MSKLLNGKENGIAIFNKVENDWLKIKGERGLFKSVELAKLYLLRVKGIKNTELYDIYIIANAGTVEELQVLYADVGRYPHPDVITYIDGFRNSFYEETNRTIYSCGYIIADSAHIKEELISIIKEKQFYYSREGALEFKHSLIDGALFAGVKESTAAIGTLSIKDLSHFNNERKNDELRVLPFIKEGIPADSMYLFSYYDVREPKWYGSCEKLDKLQSDLCYELASRLETDVRYEPVKFKGYILL